MSLLGSAAGSRLMIWGRRGVNAIVQIASVSFGARRLGRGAVSRVSAALKPKSKQSIDGEERHSDLEADSGQSKRGAWSGNEGARKNWNDKGKGFSEDSGDSFKEATRNHSRGSRDYGDYPNNLENQKYAQRKNVRDYPSESDSSARGYQGGERNVNYSDREGGVDSDRGAKSNSYRGREVDSYQGDERNSFGKSQSNSYGNSQSNSYQGGERKSYQGGERKPYQGRERNSREEPQSNSYQGNEGKSYHESQGNSYQGNPKNLNQESRTDSYQGNRTNSYSGSQGGNSRNYPRKDYNKGSEGFQGKHSNNSSEHGKYPPNRNSSHQSNKVSNYKKDYGVLNEVLVPGTGTVYGQGGKPIPVTTLRTKQFWTATTKRIFLHEKSSHSWDSLEIPQQWCENIAKMGINRPTLMQMGIFREFFQGKDIFLRCGTGTGKTFALLMSCLSFVHLNLPALTGGVACLIVVPTLPLAHQIAEWASIVTGIAKDTPELKKLIQLLVPGPIQMMNHGNEADSVPQILVALPSQLQSKETFFDWGKLRVLVLDEIDTLLKVPALSCSSDEQYKWRVNPTKLGKFLIHQTREEWLNTRPLVVASSATLERHSLVFLGQLGLEEDAIKLLTNETAPLSATTQHEYILLPSGINAEKEPELFLRTVIQSILQIYDENANRLGVLFVGQHVGAQRIKEMLSEKAVKIEFIQKALIQSEQVKMLAGWNNGLLMTSSLETYGLDIPVLDYVIILGMPNDLPAYLHMAGRVGRLRGKKDTRVITILDGKEDEKRFIDLITTANIKAAKLCPTESNDAEVISLLN